MSKKLYTLSWVHHMVDGFRAWASNQAEVSGRLTGCVPPEGEYPTMENIRSYTLALFVELGEFLQEFSWKPWKRGGSSVRDRTRLLSEFADILAFVGLLIVYLNRLGFSTEDIVEAYAMKSSVNAERLDGKAEGYEANLKAD